MRHRKISSNYKPREMGFLVFYTGLRSSRFLLSFVFLWILFAWLYIPWTQAEPKLILTLIFMGAFLCGTFCVIGLALSSLFYMLKTVRGGIPIGDIEHKINEEGIQQTSKNIEVTLSWHAIESIIPYKSHIILLTKVPYYFIALKKQSFESNMDCDIFYREAKALIGQRDSRKDKARTKRLEWEAQEKWQMTTLLRSFAKNWEDNLPKQSLRNIVGRANSQS
ncbi:YcxB family protein [Ectopseudomonas guguanensis]|uniref:YcxB-like C-terminal domain-containing protein n=1 Tax=Ectopseudomonas guguanensis TaxID=1198456 RepID=A0A1H0TVC5_9GAMM|nr:YcxB family protein [Pseudomonas guguanensis]SDP57496.1 hypothetical protein SAMN05216213_104275 [Pseudomonas guguanensis]